MSEPAVNENSIAIIGVAGRFPGAEDVRAFWKNLCGGIESVSTFSDEQLRAAGISEEVFGDPSYVRARAVLDKPEWFDAGFFGFTPREAELTDPQHRVFLECAWTALEDAGLDPATYRGAIGVYAGASLNTYLLDNIGSHREQIAEFVTHFQADGYPLLLGNDKDYLATRCAYKFNLRGPALTVQTACSTSLVAVVQAVNALLAYQCDAALAGGVSISFPQERGHLYQEAAIASGNGHTRAFDADAQGTVFGSGCGVVLLKRLKDALADGDHIYATILGAAVNNDGSNKVSYVAPSVNGQAEVISLAHSLADITADTIDYVEAHGTATPLGDPIEFNALTQAFCVTTYRTGYCLLGTVKTNVGHLESAAGVTGLIKTALALSHCFIPQNLHFTTPNPRIDFGSSPFRIVTAPTEWPQRDHPRRAGVSSFGVGGTNAHVVLEEAPHAAALKADDSPQIIVLSARSLKALEDATDRLAEYLRGDLETSLADVAWTLQTGRRSFEHRRFLIASSKSEAARLLRRRDRHRVFTTRPAPVSPNDADGLTKIGLRWLAGEEVDWTALHGCARHKVSLPTYPFQRERYWIEPQRSITVATVKKAGQTETTAPPDPLDSLKLELTAISGLKLASADRHTTLLNLGFDSLLLTQIAIALQKRFGVKLRFRQLLDELSTLGALADYCAAGTHPTKSEEAHSKRQLAPIPVGRSVAFGPFRPLQKDLAGGLAETQQRWLNEFTASYVGRTASSKAHTAKHRSHFADPRAVAGFKDVWKEMVYPIVAARSAGAHLWDLDGNEYVDTTMGFGLALFGHQPDFVMDAIQRQLELGMEIGPTSAMAGDVAELLCRLTGSERATFCNTGSEAVLGAIRIARTVTGRNKIALFAGAYHGINEEALVRPLVINGEWRTVPIAPGIVQDAVANVLLLDYGNPHSLDVIRRHADELAAVLVEPVQSRRPDLQPRDFLHELRILTKERDIALIFDEVITGFRCHPGGAQAFFGVKADIATYGKVVGGGMPIGAIAGKTEYMDAFDGGGWSYGDASYPTAGVTFFAGTFVRHPLALAAAKAVLERIHQAGPTLQSQLAEKNGRMINEIAAALEGTPFQVPHFSSLFYVRSQEFKFSGLLYALLRHRGIHIWEGRPCFISTAHSDADISRIVESFCDGVQELRRGHFISSTSCGGVPVISIEPGLTPLTDAQREVWLASQISPAASSAFNETCTLELFGALNVADLQLALSRLVQRHDALRASFATDGTGQRFSNPITPQLPVISATTEEFARLRDAEGSRTFDLAKGPLIAFQLIRLAPEHHALILTAHHIACDGWSYDILLRELAALYRGESLPEAMQFSQFVEWESEQSATAEAESAERYWLHQFRQLPPPLELPADRPRKAQRSWAGDRGELYLPAELKQGLIEYGARHGATLFATVLAGFQTLLYRLSGCDDLVIGIPAAGQNLVGGNDLIGHCANLLPLRQQISTTAFADLLVETKRTLLDAFEHQQFTYGRLLELLNLRREPNRPPLISVIFNLDPPLSDLHFGSLKHSLSVNPRKHYQFDLGFNLVEEAEGLRVECDYNPDLFDATTISRWLQQYATLLRSACSGGALHLLSPDEREQLLVTWNQTARPYPADEPVTVGFERRAAENPDAVAIVEGDVRTTYGELNALANRWARDLSGRVQAGDLVGLPAIRGSAFVARALGILKAGAAYVPFSLDDPPARRTRLTADCRIVLDLNSEPESTDISNIETSVGGGDPAYVLYTSGSTGTPKGVVVPHRAISRLVVNSDYVEFRADDNVAMASNLSFDAATFEIWGALLNGGKLIVTPADTLLTAQALGEHLARHEITTLFLTTSLFHQMVQQAPSMFSGLRNLVFGGEAADAHCVQLVLENGKPLRLVNGYGPTETTTFAVCHICEEVESRVPIGRPIANTTAYILDGALEPMPIGVAGDLYIGGPGLAIGYHGAPELTLERFVETPYGRLYHTGDVARWLPNGTIDYLGRRDHQIKLRGFRVEPDEIEFALRTVPGIGDCAVIVRDSQLVAYFAPNGAEPPDASELRERLARVLPSWMLPASFVRLPRLPLTPNGKLDHRALPAPELTPTKRDGRPETTLHIQLIELWEAVLARTPIGIHDDFFELGGHSLLAAKMLASVEARLGRRVPFSVLFERATIAHIADHLVDEQRRAASDDPVVAVQTGGKKTPMFFLHGDFSGGGFYCRNFAHYLGQDRTFFAIHPHGLHGERVTGSIEEMAADRLRSVRRTRPSGPYLLGGFCNGALIAYEMARQLQRAGESVEAVILIGADASNFKFRHLDGVARGLSRIFGEDAAAQSARFRHWRRWTIDQQERMRERFKRIRRLVEEPTAFRAKLQRFIERSLHHAKGRPSPQSIGVSEAAPGVLDAYMDALDAYVPRRFSGRVILISAKDDPFTAGRPPTYGWEELCTDLTLIEIPGEHQSSIALEQNLRVLAARLRDELDAGPLTTGNRN